MSIGKSIRSMRVAQALFGLDLADDAFEDLTNANKRSSEAEDDNKWGDRQLIIFDWTDTSSN